MGDIVYVPVKIVTGQREVVMLAAQAIGALIIADMRDEAHMLEQRLIVQHKSELLEEEEVSPGRYVVRYKPFAAMVLQGARQIAESSVITDLKRIKFRNLLKESGY